MNEIHDYKTLSRFAKTRLNEVEHQALLGVLQGLGTTRSRLLRLIIRELIGQGPDLLTHDLQTFREAVFHVGAVGRNLNQLVRAFHGGQLLDGRVDSVLLVAVRDQVAKLEKELLAVVLRSRQRWVLPASREISHG
jgi:hypothetical protein